MNPISRSRVLTTHPQEVSYQANSHDVDYPELFSCVRICISMTLPVSWLSSSCFPYPPTLDQSISDSLDLGLFFFL